MKTAAKSLALVSTLMLGLAAGPLQAQMVPLSIGAVSTNAGSKLAFVNGAGLAAGSGYVQPLTYQAWTNRYPATNTFYSTTNLLFTAVSTKTNPAAGAAIGAYIVCQVMSVTGPEGGVFSFWEQGAYWPTYNFPVGGLFVSGQNRFAVSDIVRGAGLADGDPFGAIPRRRFSVNKAGEYVVTFKLYDTSENHPALAAPIHAPSDTVSIKFATGMDLDITRFVQTNNVTTLTFKQSGLTNVFVDASTNLASWYPVAGPFAAAPLFTNTTVRSFTNDPALASVFYRLRGVTP